MGVAVIAANQSIKIDPNYTLLTNSSVAGNFDSGIVTWLAAPANGYLKFKNIPWGNTITNPTAITEYADPTVTFTVTVPGSNKETEMQIYICGALVYNSGATGANTLAYTINLRTYDDFVLNNGLSIQYRMRGAGALAGSQSITYPNGRIQVLAFSNSP